MSFKQRRELWVGATQSVLDMNNTSELQSESLWLVGAPFLMR